MALDAGIYPPCDLVSLQMDMQRPVHLDSCVPARLRFPPYAPVALDLIFSLKPSMLQQILVPWPIIFSTNCLAIVEW